MPSSTTVSRALAACLPSVVGPSTQLDIAQQQQHARMSPPQKPNPAQPTPAITTTASASSKLALSVSKCLPAALSPTQGAALVHVRILRAENLLPIGFSAADLQTQEFCARVVCWVAGSPAAQSETTAVTVSVARGDARWDEDGIDEHEANELVLSLPRSNLGSALVFEVHLLKRAAIPDEDGVADLAMNDDGTGNASVVDELPIVDTLGVGIAHLLITGLNAGGSMWSEQPIWLRAEGTGRPRLDGEAFGGSDLLVSAAIEYPSTTNLSEIPMEQSGDRSSNGGVPHRHALNRSGDAGDAAAASAASSMPALSAPPTSRVPVASRARDTYGFALQVPESVHAQQLAHRALIHQRQVRHWQELGAWFGPPMLRPAHALRAAAIGVPAALRPRLWMHYSAADAMRKEAGVQGSYNRLLALQAATSPAVAAKLAGTEGLPSYASARAALERHVPVPEHLPMPSWLLAAAKHPLRWWRRRAWCTAQQPSQGTMEEVTRQIELDLPRTFPEHSVFASAAGRDALRRVLHAHACRNPQIGYTQSMNFIAAFLLLQCPASGVEVSDGLCDREEAAFWMLCAITEKLLPEHYTSGMIGVRVDNLVLVDLLNAYSPLREVMRVLHELDLDLSIVSTQWLLLAFVNALPTDTALRLWDLFFVAGSRALIAASFAALTLLKDQVASAEGSFEDAYKALKDGLPHVSVDEDRFVRCMLEALHDLPADRLRELRERYRGAILIETAEREARLRARRNGAKQAGFLSLTGSLAAAVLLVAAAAISLAVLDAADSLGYGWRFLNALTVHVCQWPTWCRWEIART